MKSGEDDRVCRRRRPSGASSFYNRSLFHVSQHDAKSFLFVSHDDLFFIYHGDEQNNPLYIQSFTEADDALKLHHIVHCSLDVVDERGIILLKLSFLNLDQAYLGQKC